MSTLPGNYVCSRSGIKRRDKLGEYRVGFEGNKEAVVTGNLSFTSRHPDSFGAGGGRGRKGSLQSIKIR